MIHTELLEEILGVYRKHGWNVTGFLLTRESLESLGAQHPSLAGSSVEIGEIDAVWLDRPSRNGKRAIELRWLSSNPLALFELVGENESAEEVLDKKRKMEETLLRRASRTSSNGKS